MSWHRYKIKITLRSPFLIPSTQVEKWGHDSSQMRNASGRPIIPGDLIKGMMRHAMRQLGKTQLETDLFGKTSRNNQNSFSGNIRGRISISDLVSITEPPVGGSYTRVAISESTGAARTGHLQTVELAYPAGQEVCFTGTMSVMHPNREEFEPWLEKAIALIPAVGANKSAGFGEVVEQGPERRLVHQSQIVYDIKETGQNFPDQVNVRLTFDRPVLFDAERVAHNVYHSSKVISGTTIKGALASAICGSDGFLSGPKGNALGKMRFGFAWPEYEVSEDERQCHYPPLPLSLMVHPEDGRLVFNAASQYKQTRDPLPYLINGEVPVLLSKAKKKLQKEAQKEIGRYLEPLRMDVRTRTSIEAGSNIASEGELFSYAMISPDNTCWVCQIDRNGADDALYQELLIQLQQGLPRVGKTEAIAKVDISAVTGDVVNPAVDYLSDGIVIVQLTSPAIMIDPDIEYEIDKDTASLNDDGLLAVYAKYWNQISDGDLVLRQIFTQEQLIGGYQAHVHRFRSVGDGDYHPYLLTEAGSVFVLETTVPNSANRKIGQWLRTGLPLPEWVNSTIRNDRLTCPYVPENGYGSFIIDPSSTLNLPERDKLELQPVESGVSNVW